MPWKPNANRRVVNGIAQVSAKELANFQDEYGANKTLRDLLNADKQIARKAPASTNYEVKPAKPVIDIEKLASDEAQDALNERNKQTDRIGNYSIDDVKSSTDAGDDWRKRKGGAIKKSKKKHSSW